MSRRGPKSAEAPVGDPVKLAVPRGWPKPLGDVWREVVWPLGVAGLVEPQDAPGLQAFVMSIDSMRKAQRVLDVEGYFVESPNGYRIAHPAVAIRDGSIREVRAWSAKFGLTIADRGRVRIPESKATPQQRMTANIGESPAQKLRVV